MAPVEPVQHVMGEEVDTHDVRISITWRNRGSVTLTPGGQRFRYNDIPTGPGTYRIRVHADGEQRHCYIGHSKNLRSRVAEDIRDHAAVIRPILAAGGNVQVDRAEDVRFAEGGSDGDVIEAARGEFARLMVEGLAVAIESPNLGMLNRARHRP